MKTILPTPKVTAALLTGLFVFALMMVAESYGWTDVQAEAQTILILVLSWVGAWFKRDGSSPEDDNHGVEV